VTRQGCPRPEAGNATVPLIPAKSGGGGISGDGGGAPSASSGGNTYQPVSCARPGTGCGGYIPPVFDQVPGGSLGFLAGLGGSLAGTVDLAQCALNPLLCALQQATGAGPSGLYTGWVHS
jgi:hypothetical protein